MLRQTIVTGETHRIGGDGIIMVGNSERLDEHILNEYAGRVRLIYLDPPFGTGGAFEFKDKTAVRAYSDRQTVPEYLIMMRQVLSLSKALLDDDGSIYVHIDYRMSGKIRQLMDEIFGEENLMNELIWSYKSGGRSIKHYSRKHDTILFYRKTKKVYFDITATGTPRGGARRNHMKRRADENGRIYFSIRSGGREYRYYEDEPVYPSDVWDDIEHLHQRDPERTGFSTQKPVALLKRVIAASSREGDLVADLFGGSGTTAFTAALLGRRFFVCDKGAASLLATRRRLIEAGGEVEFTSAARPLSVRYLDPVNCQSLYRADKLLDFEPSKGGLVAKIREDGSDGCAFVSRGFVSGGIFHAEAYITRPKRGDELFLKKGEALHIVDSNCTQGYFVVE